MRERWIIKAMNGEWWCFGTCSHLGNSIQPTRTFFCLKDGCVPSIAHETYG